MMTFGEMRRNFLPFRRPNRPRFLTGSSDLSWKPIPFSHKLAMKK
ncbi:hypothetical protein B4135_3384 [Caldibacillus debilis]|uniref:Uncharacterized protein n=1 Tax=Caldibacillus debilis TaxID=301148 RepID=A0A150LE10_9BACI|nr:hypothetical protein B4135_3384 [Caldibacillus debilis]